MAKNKQEELYQTWDHLFERIMKAHPARRKPSEVREDLEKEFLRVARALKRDDQRMFSCRILIIENLHVDNSQVTIKSRDGFAVNIYEEHYQWFLQWALPYYEDDEGD